MDCKVFLQRKYKRGFIVTSEFLGDDEITYPSFISQYRIVRCDVDEQGFIIHSDSYESVPWIDNPNA